MYSGYGKKKKGMDPCPCELTTKKAKANRTWLSRSMAMNCALYFQSRRGRVGVWDSPAYHLCLYIKEFLCPSPEYCALNSFVAVAVAVAVILAC